MTDTTTTLPEPKSAKEFQEPLLAALYALSGGKSGVAVAFSDTYQPVMDQMGITGLDAFGCNDDGKEKVAQWIQWAFKNLKRTGQVQDAGRGQWALSDKGVAEAASMSTTAMSTTVTSTVPPVAGVSTPVSRGHEEATYHPDPYIRTLAAAATSCFGGFSHKSDICERCTLQGPCINFLAAELSRLTAVLQREDEAEAQRIAAAKVAAEAAKHKAQQPAAAPTPAAAGPAPDFDWSGWDLDGARDIIAKAESTCPRCGKPVQRGHKAKWLRAKKGTMKRKQAVLFHKDCVPAK